MSEISDRPLESAGVARAEGRYHNGQVTTSTGAPMPTIRTRTLRTMLLVTLLHATVTATADPPSTRKGIIVWDNTAFGLAAAPRADNAWKEFKDFIVKKPPPPITKSQQFAMELFYKYAAQGWGYSARARLGLASDSRLGLALRLGLEPG